MSLISPRQKERVDVRATSRIGLASSRCHVLKELTDSIDIWRETCSNALPKATKYYLILQAESFELAPRIVVI